DSLGEHRIRPRCWASNPPEKAIEIDPSTYPEI
ncbi:MAG: hypothetical protein ACJAVJ_001772, partial [Planctomycetota bacterium]